MAQLLIIGAYYKNGRGQLCGPMEKMHLGEPYFFRDAGVTQELYTETGAYTSESAKKALISSPKEYLMALDLYSDEPLDAGGNAFVPDVEQALQSIAYYLLNKFPRNLWPEYSLNQVSGFNRDQAKSGIGPTLLGQKQDSNKPRYSLLVPEFVSGMIDVMEYGAKKYSKDNWKHVPEFKDRYYDAAMRHISAWRCGAVKDAESDRSHLLHAACCLMFLYWRDTTEDVC